MLSFFRKTDPAAFNGYLRAALKPRVLIVINHFFGQSLAFRGKSSTQTPENRLNILESVITTLKRIPHSDVVLCGFSSSRLTNIDVTFDEVSTPTHLVYESLKWMTYHATEYDYFVNIEDDILLTPATFTRTVAFDLRHNLTQCFHPNRIEYGSRGPFCVDLDAVPGWQGPSIHYKGHNLRIANNPHSGLCILSKPKLLHAMKTVDFDVRTKHCGHHMASAFANIHRPFELYRSSDDILYHHVTHLDRWVK